MKTLVIHPDDRSTDFLSAIYRDKFDWSVININVSDSTLKQEILSHDRIIMMGHGTPWGLLGYNKYVITPEFVYLLRDPNKKYVFIWCNADRFVLRYNLRGFYTGMFISEISEAYFFGFYKVNEDIINYSNNLFAETFNKAIDTDNMYNKILSEYDNYVQPNPIILFNKERLYER